MHVSTLRRALVLAVCAALSVSLTDGSAAAVDSGKPAKPAKPVVTGVDNAGFASGSTTGTARVTITGRNFTHVTSVSFGGAVGKKLTVRSSHTLQVTAPVHQIGEVQVRVTTRAGTSAATGSDVYDFQDRQRLAGGFGHSCQVVGSAGGVRCWGDNQSGDLGDGTMTERDSPVAVSGLKRVVAVAAGDQFSCALQASGAVLCWGANSNGQLGVSNISGSTVPVRVEKLPRAIAIATGEDDDTCAVVVGNSVYCWGLNGEGQLGDGTHNLRPTPKPVHHLTSAVSISLGGDFACATRANGTNLCWGGNPDGGLGDGSFSSSTLPVQTVGITTAVAVSTGGSSTCVLLRNGAVRCWGLGTSGQLGNGANATSSTPVTVKGIAHATQLAVGGGHGCAVVGTDELCWGENAHGQLGDATNDDASTPAAVDGLDDVTAIGVGSEHSLAVSQGVLSAWGSNQYGQLGDGSTTDSDLPVQVG